LSSDVRVLDVHGALNAATSPRLEEAIGSLIAQSDRLVVLNLSDVPNLDRAALTVIFGSLKRLREKDGDLAIVTGSLLIQRVFELIQMGKILPITHSEADAASILASRSGSSKSGHHH